MGLRFLYESENSGGIPEAGLGPVIPGWIIHVDLNGWPLPAHKFWPVPEAYAAPPQSPSTSPHQSLNPGRRRRGSSAASAVTAARQVLAELPPLFWELQFFHSHTSPLQKDWAAYMDPNHRHGVKEIRLWGRICSFSVCILWGVREKTPCSFSFPRKEELSS